MAEIEINRSNQNQDPLDQLREMLTRNEIECLVEALSSIVNKQNGYGTIEIDVRQKRIYVLGVRSTIKPEN